MTDEIKKLSNDSRETPRWTAYVWYKTAKGPIYVPHDFSELSELEEIMERGPSWLALIRIEITYNNECEELTIEEAEKL